MRLNISIDNLDNKDNQDDLLLSNTRDGAYENSLSVDNVYEADGMHTYYNQGPIDRQSLEQFEYGHPFFDPYGTTKQMHQDKALKPSGTNPIDVVNKILEKITISISLTDFCFSNLWGQSLHKVLMTSGQKFFFSIQYLI